MVILTHVWKEDQFLCKSKCVYAWGKGSRRNFQFANSRSANLQMRAGVGDPIAQRDNLRDSNV